MTPKPRGTIQQGHANGSSSTYPFSVPHCFVIALHIAFSYEAKFHNTKNEFVSKLPRKKNKNTEVKKYFPAPFRPLLDKIGSRTVTKMPRPKDIF